MHVGKRLTTSRTPYERSKMSYVGHVMKPFLVAQIFAKCWLRSDPLSAFFLSSHSSVKVKRPPFSTCTYLEHQPKGDRRPTDLHLNSLWMTRHLTLGRTSTWYMTQRLSWSGLEPTSLVHWANILTSRPPSPPLQFLFPLYIDSRTQFLKVFNLQHTACLWNMLSFVFALHVYIRLGQPIWVKQTEGPQSSTNQGSMMPLLALPERSLWYVEAISIHCLS